MEANVSKQASGNAAPCSLTSNEARLRDLIDKLDSERRALDAESKRLSVELKNTTETREATSRKADHLKALSAEMNDKIKYIYHDIKVKRDNIQRMKASIPMLNRHEQLMLKQTREKREINDERWIEWRAKIHDAEERRDQTIKKWNALPWVGDMKEKQEKLSQLSHKLSEIKEKCDNVKDQSKLIKKELEEGSVEDATQLIIQFAEMMVRRKTVMKKVGNDQKKIKRLKEKMNQKRRENEEEDMDTTPPVEEPPPTSPNCSLQSDEPELQTNYDEQCFKRPAIARVMSDPRVLALQKEAAMSAKPKSPGCLKTPTAPQPIPKAIPLTPVVQKLQVHFPYPVVSNTKSMTPSPTNSAVSSTFSPGPSASQQGSPEPAQQIDTQRSDVSSVLSDDESLRESINERMDRMRGGATQELLAQSQDPGPPEQTPVPIAKQNNVVPQPPKEPMPETPMQVGSVEPDSPEFALPGEGDDDGSVEGSKTADSNFLAMFGFGSKRSPSPTEEATGISGFSFFASSQDDENEGETPTADKFNMFGF